MHKARMKQLSNMHIGDRARSMPIINVALDDHRAKFQPIMIKCEGTIVDQPISVLFD